MGHPPARPCFPMLDNPFTLELFGTARGSNLANGEPLPQCLVLTRAQAVKFLSPDTAEALIYRIDCSPPPDDVFINQGKGRQKRLDDEKEKKEETFHLAHRYAPGAIDIGKEPERRLLPTRGGNSIG